MSSEPVCQVARSWVEVGSFQKRLFGVVCFAIASFREFLDTPSYRLVKSVPSSIGNRVSPPSSEMGNTECILSEDEERTFLRNAGKFVPKCMTSNLGER
jgi:hypothetical protein